MSDNSSAQKVPDQSALPSQVDQAHENPKSVTDKPTSIDEVSSTPSGDQPASAKSQPENVTIDPPTDKTVIHLPPVTTDEKIVVPPAAPAADKPPAVAAQPVPAETQAAKVLPSPSADDTLPRKPSTNTGPQIVAASPIAPPVAEPLPDVENPYVLSGEVDRARLVAQTRLFRQYIEQNVVRLVGKNLNAILDIGCGEGQLTQVFAKLYPAARVVGIDKDEKAIDLARRQARSLPNVEYEIGDIQDHLPMGPFDLVYGSMVLFHVSNTTKVVELIFSVLKPGGYFWSKDLDVSEMPVPGHPSFNRMAELFLPVHKLLGGHATIVQELPDILRGTGFTNVKTERETYPFGNTSPEGRIVMAVNLGAFYNARKIVSKLNQIPESDVEKVYKEACDSLMAANAPTGRYNYGNTLGRRPVQPAT